MNKKIFVTGAAGYIGAAISRKLVRSGHEVFGLTHSKAKAPLLLKEGIKPIFGDLNAPQTYARGLKACDVIIHAAFENGPKGPSTDRYALKTIGAALKSAKARRLFIYTSGVWILGRQLSKAADRASARKCRFRICWKAADEKTPPHPLPNVAWRPEHETIALQFSGGPATALVVRPGCVYGGKGGLYGEMIQSAIERRMIRLVGEGMNRWANVHIDDLADLYLLIAEKALSGGIYHATDGSFEPVKKIAEAFLNAAGGGRLEHEPLEDARKILGPFADALALNQRVSSDKSKKEFGWKPKYNSVAANAKLLIQQWATG